MLKKIDLNADVGESLYDHRVGEDETLIPLLSSANIACGFHGGDPTTMIRAIDLCIKHSVRIGAHPSYDDRAYDARAGARTPSFGREERNLPPAEIGAQLEYQLAAIRGLAESRGAGIAHVKLHGALYHRVSSDLAAAQAALTAIKKILPHAAVVAQAGSPFIETARNAGFKVVGEAFADRRYLSDGKLAPRAQPDAVLKTPEEIAAQALMIAARGEVATNEASFKLKADTLCLHGDHPGVTAAAKAVRAAFQTARIEVGAP